MPLEGPYGRNLHQLASSLCLNDTEKALMEFGVAIALDARLADALDRIYPRTARNAAKLLAFAINADFSLTARSFERSGKLLRLNVFEEYAPPDVLLAAATVPSSIVSLLGQRFEHRSDLLAHFAAPPSPPTLTFSDIPHLSGELTILAQLLRTAAREHQKAVNVLLYGLPGVGKTEFVKLVAVAARINLLAIPVFDA